MKNSAKPNRKKCIEGVRAAADALLSEGASLGSVVSALSIVTVLTARKSPDPKAAADFLDEGWRFLHVAAEIADGDARKTGAIRPVRPRKPRKK